jgi:hypothetical protein
MRACQPRLVAPCGVQARQQPAVVQLSVGQYDEVEGARVEGEGREVLRTRLAIALERAAVDEEANGPVSK